MIGGHGVGGAYSHIKAFGLSPIPHIKGNSVLKFLLGGHALGMLGRTLIVDLYSKWLMWLASV